MDMVTELRSVSERILESLIRVNLKHSQPPGSFWCCGQRIDAPSAHDRHAGSEEVEELPECLVLGHILRNDLQGFIEKTFNTVVPGQTYLMTTRHGFRLSRAPDPALSE